VSTQNQVGICNAALSYAGQSTRIARLEESSTAAELCRAHYDDALRYVLSCHDWAFARKRQTLPLSSEDAPSEWAYRYGLPSDCVEPRAIEDGLRVRPGPAAIVWEAEGETLLTDQPDAVLIYTSLATVPARYPQAFADALAWELASRIVLPLTKNAKTAEYARNRAAYQLSVARAKDLNRGQRDVEPDGEFVTGRG
jgi:hypothetical protein